MEDTLYNTGNMSTLVTNQKQPDVNSVYTNLEIDLGNNTNTGNNGINNKTNIAEEISNKLREKYKQD